MNNTYVTLFLDIGRSSWTSYSRSFDQYLPHFLPYTRLFNISQENVMYAFIDERYTSILEKYIENTKINVIPINEKWMLDNLFMWKFLDREEEIMKSEYFRSLIPQHRLDKNPETYQAKYTLINHCKIDLIRFIIDNYPKTDFYTWVDFGYFKFRESIPHKLMNITKFNPNNITYPILHYLTENDKNPINILKTDLVKICGYCFTGGINVMMKYQELYHSVLQDYQNLGIADDDQSFIIQCFFKSPELFSFFKSDHWHIMLYAFQ